MAEIVGLVIKVPANTVTKKPTDYLNVGVSFSYRGPAQRVHFTAVVTQETWYGEFDEIGSTRKMAYSDIPASDVLRYWSVTVPNLPLSGVEPKTTPYGVKIKAEGTFGTIEAGNKACLYVAPIIQVLTIRLKNYQDIWYPPNYWTLVIYDKDGYWVGGWKPVDYYITGKNYIQEIANFSNGWEFPLKVDLRLFYMVDVAFGYEVYHVQSVTPIEPNYTPGVTIPGYGDYYYNVATGQFERIE